MKALFQNLIQEFTAVASEKDELEFRDMSELKSLVPLMAYQDSNSDVAIIFWDIWKQKVCFKYKATEIATLMEKTEISWIQEIEVWTLSCVNTESIFRQLWFIKIRQRGTNSTIL